MDLRRMLPLAAVLAVVVLVLIWVFAEEQSAALPTVAPVQPAAAAQLAPLPAAPAAVKHEPLPLTPEDHAFLQKIRDKFGPRKNDKHARIKAIEQILAYLQQHYPLDWRERAATFLRELFPELADELIAHFEGLVRLNEWLAAQRAELLRLSPEERRAALWAARREAFGADAELIYAGELRAERLQDSLQALNAAPGLSTDEKLGRYLDSIQQTWGEDAPGFIEARQTELMNRFLDVPAVQDDLRRLPLDAQRDSLRRIRSGMGLDEAALQRWDALDQVRDQAWNTGQNYQLQRAALLARPESAERAQQLRQLQDQLFGTEADTIRAEEEAGFFRYGQTRRIGRE